MHRHFVLVSALLGAAFVIVLGGELPDPVASNFGLSGVANATLPRGTYVTLMVLLTVGVPMISWWLQVRALARGKAKIPHADHWFSEPQRSRTERFLEWHAALFCVALIGFLSFVHWLAYKANTGSAGPAPLDLSQLLVGSAAFVAVTLAWVMAPLLRFRGGG